MMETKVKDLKHQIKILKDVCNKYNINLKFTPYRKYLKEDKKPISLEKIEKTLLIQFE